MTKDSCCIPLTIRKTITIKPLPKNMHPDHHEGRTARARALAKKREGRQDVVYVDAAASYPQDKRAFTIVAATETGQLLANATIKTKSSEVAEEAAIALAMTNQTTTIIVSDPKSSHNTFSTGRISVTSLKILRNYPSYRNDVELIWVPAHSSERGSPYCSLRIYPPSCGQRLGHRIDPTRHCIPAYHKIMQNYELGRREFPRRIKT